MFEVTVKHVSDAFNTGTLNSLTLAGTSLQIVTAEACQSGVTKISSHMKTSHLKCWNKNIVLLHRKSREGLLTCQGHRHRKKLPRNFHASPYTNLAVSALFHGHMFIHQKRTMLAAVDMILCKCVCNTRTNTFTLGGNIREGCRTSLAGLS